MPTYTRHHAPWKHPDHGFATFEGVKREEGGETEKELELGACRRFAQHWCRLCSSTAPSWGSEPCSPPTQSYTWKIFSCCNVSKACNRKRNKVENDFFKFFVIFPPDAPSGDILLHTALDSRPVSCFAGRGQLNIYRLARLARLGHLISSDPYSLYHHTKTKYIYNDSPNPPVKATPYIIWLNSTTTTKSNNNNQIKQQQPNWTTTTKLNNNNETTQLIATQ